MLKLNKLDSSDVLKLFYEYCEKFVAMKRLSLCCLLLMLLSAPLQSQVLLSLIFGDKLNSDGVEFGLEGGYNFSNVSNLEAGGTLADRHYLTKIQFCDHGTFRGIRRTICERTEASRGGDASDAPEYIFTGRDIRYRHGYRNPGRSSLCRQYLRFHRYPGPSEDHLDGLTIRVSHV